MNKHGLTTALAKFLFNPLVRGLFAIGVAAPGTAILETTGRRSGKPRRTPVTNGLLDGSFWVVAEHGPRAAYVRNLEANPRVRVKLGRRWHPGTAQIVAGDDPRERLRKIARARPLSRLNVAAVRVMQTELLSVRIELDDQP